MASTAPKRRRVRTSHQVNFRLPWDVWIQLTTAARVLRRPQAQIVTDALKLYFESITAAERRAIESSIALLQKPDKA